MAYSDIQKSMYFCFEKKKKPFECELGKNVFVTIDKYFKRYYFYIELEAGLCKLQELVYYFFVAFVVKLNIATSNLFCKKEKK